MHARQGRDRRPRHSTSRSLELLTEACADLPVIIRKMFGGHGFFAPNGGMFAGIVTDDEVILKLVHGPARDELIADGGHPWVYAGKQKPMTMSEWIVVPQRFYDDPEAFTAWATRAFELAPPKKAKKPNLAKSARPVRPASR
jgi:DNA transformation protein and related proteins